MVATRFAVAAHILLLLARHGRGYGALPEPPATSARLATIVNTNPVVIRRITGQLARAGLIKVFRGPGGAALARAPEDITLDDVWRAVNAGAARPLVPLHAGKPSGEPGGRDMHAVLEGAFASAEAAFRQSLRHTTLDMLAGEVHRKAA
jgi:DNA-binding IscR family transcriptional regulator